MRTDHFEAEKQEEIEFKWGSVARKKWTQEKNIWRIKILGLDN